jgi:hypothetical protein
MCSQAAAHSMTKRRGGRIVNAQTFIVDGGWISRL